MLPIEKNKDLIDQIVRVTRRADNIHEAKDKLFNFMRQVMELSSSFSVRINLDMTKFEEFVVKNSLYYEKSNHIINLSKLYREFSLQIERASKLNLIGLGQVRQEAIQKQDDKLKQKCGTCVKQFEQYSLQERDYNRKYGVYHKQCDDLTLIISRYKSYQNPVAFYNKILTS